MILSLNTKRVGALLGLFVFLMPVLALAQVIGSNPAPTNTGITYECPPVTKTDANGNVIKDSKGNPTLFYGECTFDNFIAAIIKVTKYAALLALSFSIVVIAWAGFNYMISGDNPQKRKEANRMLMSVVKGIAFILLAWLIVTFITKGLLLKPEIKTYLGS